ncbi:ABC transporter ATP-binding protein [Pseudomonas sp. Eqa60]|jgi:peptide/nickel transport system ATP-binding protein|uniref:ABC-type dipeptide transporter n=1 Tax=Pseudomonas protegens (strain DSM 19095 / LMG 27888 / CFBP 6595 / CHA0) TaxID=1124983 RepID=A0A2C9EUF0_PSEPH|nr:MULTISPECIES: ABC transporter ATP-binding protein [Pseudomonas]AGL87306.1 glutathione import ATP-binding protein GsiA [Pseudomonas protegens CHA0]MBP5110411.1 ABC transporter ATP-binding protein [Pseudomonas protegens]QTU27276.1 ABC transporter ATP-binding protein [Pseudomonas protegens]QTU30912.1 ABC transporter ATP-binding protein [Pseudomonas protegens]RLO21166.1 ABC transporter ATP-binding protein [Pseudomonas protegens]
MTVHPSDKPLLEIHDLRIEGHYQDAWHPLIKGIDLSLQRGEVLGLIGESGAGKSTLGLASMGYVRDGCRITGGSVRFDGQELVGAKPEALRKLRGLRIAYVAQSAAASFNPAHRLIDQHVETAVRNAGIDRAKAQAEAVELYRILRLPNPEQIGQRYPHQVSGGQLQRVMTAMAMACHPDLIIFDEPTTALDVTTQIEVLVAIRDAVKTYGSAALYISHDLAVVAQMADRIMVLRHGKLVEEADTRTMLDAPQQDYTKSLWAVRSLRTEPKPCPPQATPLLEVRKASASYGHQPVLHDVSLKLYRGQTLAVIGESGSGKSSTARLITGLLPPTSGQVLYDGKALPADYRQRSKEQLRRLQMIYQIPDTALNPRQRIVDIIGRPLSFYLGLKGQALRQRVAELLEMIELDPALYMDRQPRELSGGQKQRICIARALAAEPQLIICDEVTSALDQLVAEGVLKLLNRIQQQLGVAYLFITHDVATVRAIADEVLVMQRGKVVDHGCREEIFTPPYRDYTGLLFSSEPEMDPDWLDHLLEKRALVS